MELYYPTTCTAGHGVALAKIAPVLSSFRLCAVVCCGAFWPPTAPSAVQLLKTRLRSPEMRCVS